MGEQELTWRLRVKEFSQMRVRMSSQTVMGLAVSRRHGGGRGKSCRRRENVH